jgi:multidrug efflux pump subunit AcrB
MLRAAPVNGAAAGELVQLSNFVRLDEARGPNQIDRFQRQRRVTIQSNLAPNYALGEGVRFVEEQVREMNLPPEYSVVFVGRAKQLQETLQNFLYAFLAAVLFMYMILAAQFEHFVVSHRHHAGGAACASVRARLDASASGNSSISSPSSACSCSSAL